MTDQEPLDSAIGWVAEHTKRYVDSGGEDGHLWKGWPTAVLTTTGRRSGAARRNALIYGEDSGDHILVASYGGRDDHPLWYLNLVANPVVTLQVRAEVLHGTATTVDDAAERDRLFAYMATIYPPYLDYQAKTARRIPVVRVDVDRT